MQEGWLLEGEKWDGESTLVLLCWMGPMRQPRSVLIWGSRMLRLGDEVRTEVVRLRSLGIPYHFARRTQRELAREYELRMQRAG